MAKWTDLITKYRGIVNDLAGKVTRLSGDIASKVDQSVIEPLASGIKKDWNTYVTQQKQVREATGGSPLASLFPMREPAKFLQRIKIPIPIGLNIPRPAGFNTSPLPKVSWFKPFEETPETTTVRTKIQSGQKLNSQEIKQAEEASMDQAMNMAMSSSGLKSVARDTNWARNILKLPEGATSEDISSAYRNLIKGEYPRTIAEQLKTSKVNAAKMINKAKDLLLKNLEGEATIKGARSLPGMVAPEQPITPRSSAQVQESMLPAIGKGETTAAENMRTMERLRQKQYGVTPKTVTPIETEIEKGTLKQQMGEGLLAKKEAPEEVVNTVRDAIYSGDKEGAAATYQDLSKEYQLPSYQSLTDEIDKIQSQELGGVAKETAQQESNQPYGETIGKFKNFLRIAGEKKSQATGELFREHIPRSVFGVSSDEVASDLGKSETEFMGELMSNIEVVSSGRATPKQISRFFNNVKRAKKLNIQLPKPLHDFYNSLSEQDYHVLRTHGELGYPVAVSAQAGEATLEKIAKKEGLNIEREAKRVYDEWQKAIRQGTVSAKGRVGQVADLVKESTDQAIREKLYTKAGKIFAIDFRSPEIVFKKLGLHEEVYTPIKQGQESTTREIENGYQLLNKWFKELKGNSLSSVKVFDWLDGNKNIPLTDQEQKVATEIKTYLSDWANKLGIPESQRIRDYITHLFEPDLVGGKRTIPEELSRILDYVKPRGVYDPFLEQRTNAYGYKRDVFAALDAYIRRGARKLYLDRPIENASRYADFEGSQAQKYLDNYLKNLLGRPDNFEKWADENIISALPEKIRQVLGPRPFARIVSAVRGQVYRGALGLNVGSAVKNITQNVNTLAELGPRKTVAGMVDLLRNGTKELVENQVLDEMIIADYRRKTFGSLLNRIDPALFYFFETAEKINRGVGYFAAKREALSKGMAEEQAIEFAKAIVRKTQFAYGKTDMPLALQSSLGKLGFQFGSYPIKQLELLGGYARNKEFAKLLRYIISTIALTAAIGDLLGMDLGEFYNIFPTLGPVPQLGMNLWGAAKGDWQAKGRLAKAPLLFIPGGLQARKTYDAIRNLQKGYSETAGGKKRFEAPKTLGGQAQSLLFGQWATPEAEAYLRKQGIKKSEIPLPFGLGTKLFPNKEEKARQEKKQLKSSLKQQKDYYRSIYPD